MPRAKRICLTGGGTAGHVIPHFALLASMRSAGWDVFYIGSRGVEQGLVTGKEIPFFPIAAGKLRRYFSVENMIDIFRVGWGTLQAFFVLLRQRPNVVFSKGGYVSVPVAVAAWMLRIPVVSHESDLSPGLANRLIARFAKRLVYTFPETGKYLPANSQWVGLPVRAELGTGSTARGAELCGFRSDDQRPVILVMGGSQGAAAINQAVASQMNQIGQSYRVVHLTGRGKDPGIEHEAYKSFEYLGDELADVLALADAVISRAGANSIFELLTLRKPMLLIPLQVGSRGDQVENAKVFAGHGWAEVIQESEISDLANRIQTLMNNRDSMIKAQAGYEADNVTAKILAVLGEVAV